MKNIAITIFVILILLVLGLYLVSFQVSETESALVTTFGKPIRTINEPGWYFKWPAPIQQVERFDSRMRVFEGDLTETTTKGAIPIIVNTYVVWKITEPLEFFNAVGTVREAENKLRSQLSDTQNKIIGQYAFSEFVNSDKSKIKLPQIEQNMLADLKESVRADYGIEIRSLGIKQLKVSDDVSKDVFERMRAERRRKTAATISEGTAMANTIRDDADLKKTVLLIAAEARAKIIRGEGDAEAAKYYEMLDANRELAMFLRGIETLKETLKQRTTIVISADTEPFILLRKMPTLEPKSKSD